MDYLRLRRKDTEEKKEKVIRESGNRKRVFRKTGKGIKDLSADDADYRRFLNHEEKKKHEVLRFKC